jgi:hypothetical protein
MVTRFAASSTHGHQSAAQGSSTTVSRSDIRLIQYLGFSALGLVRRYLYIGYFLILYYPPLTGVHAVAQEEATSGPGEGQLAVRLEGAVTCIKQVSTSNAC